MTSVRGSPLEGRVINTYGSATNPQSTALGQAAETAVRLTILILITAVATSGVIDFDTRQVDIECAVFKIDRAALCSTAVSVVEDAAVSACSAVGCE